MGVLFAPWLVGLVAADWVRHAPAKFELAVTLTRIMFPFLLLVALAAQAMGVLNSPQQIWRPGTLASTLFNVGSVHFRRVAGNLARTRRRAFRASKEWRIGVVIGGALQLLWQVPSLCRAGFRFQVAFDWIHPGMGQHFRLMVPAILGNAAVQINVMVNTYFASTINDPVRGMDGPVSWLGYAFRFMQLPLGLFGVAIASATLPAIGSSAASGNMDEFRHTLARSLGLVFVLTVPSSVGLVILGRSIIGAIYEGVSSRHTTRSRLRWHCPATPSDSPATLR